MSSWFDWRAAFVAGAISAAGALTVAIVFFPRDARPQQPPPGGRLLDFKPVFRNRSAMAYAVGYCVHTWEMFVVRSWAVTFLVFTAAQSGERINFFIPTVVAMLMELVGTVMSVVGNELAVRIGRQRWILTVMVCCMGISLIVGFSAAWGYGIATAICLLYNALIYADSASLTAGTVGCAEPGRRGATLAIHAMMGYGGGFVGPLVMGILLDRLGGESLLNWGLGFAHLAVIMLVGPAAFAILKPRDISGDRPAR